MKNIEIESKITEILSQMTVREKIGQLNQASYLTADLNRLKEGVRKGEIGSFVLSSSCFAGNDDQDAVMRDDLNELQRIAVEESRLKIPLIYGRDVIYGYKTTNPTPLAMAASFNMELIKRAYRYTAEEATNDGVHWAFTPMLDVCRDPRWGRVIECPGEDPYLGAQFAKAAVSGLQGEDNSKQDSMAACAKHYIGYGACEGGRDYNRVEISDYTLRNNYLKAFKSAVDSGVASVMSSFNEISGIPVTTNKYLLTDLLKDELGFDGFVVSDWGTVRRAERQGVAENQPKSIELAFNSGVDVDMAVEGYITELEPLIGKEISIKRLDDAVRRVLRIKMQFGLFEHPYTEQRSINRSVYIAGAREIAQESMVLLKNNNNILPLKNINSLALIGPAANVKRPFLGSWSLDGLEEPVITLKEGVTAIAEKVGINVLTAEREMYDEMARAASEADVVVLALGESHMVTGEARCLSNIELPPEQKELVKRVKALGKPIVGVLCFGRPIALGDMEGYFDAMLYAWHCGEQAGNAAADILFGNVNPSGKLPITFPRVTGQVPIYYNVASSGRYCAANGAKPVNGYYGLIKDYEDCLGIPLYPFGYGLSYTEFEYSGIRADKFSISLSDIEKGESFKVSVKVKNIGESDGKEVIECFVYDECASMMRPLKELKAFSKLMFKAGEERTVEFLIGKEELGFYNFDKKFVVEKGYFTIYIGRDCYTDNCIRVEVC